jgi:ribosomal protein S18 acetylase RimI-like enzyme
MSRAMPMEIRKATSRYHVDAAAEAFDEPVEAPAADRFLRESGHHQLVAYIDGQVAGMVTGVEMTHPDKGTEMFLYELGVIERWRGQGVGAALVAALRDLAAASGCYGMWVLTDEENQAAIRTYRSAGASGGSAALMLDWDLEPPARRK